ncbi:hypothetical protein [Candidatus Electronema sp. PJ]|uniref:hypothetical protein n=1 Tax=Candidatus Electronema sp. PJ TaxID=3401572 RepID=UPI003AA7EC14
MSKQTTILVWIGKLGSKLFGNRGKKQPVWEDLAAQAEQAAAQGAWLTAAELLSQIQAACPEPSRLLRLAFCRVQAGQWQLAATAYAEAVALSPADRYHAGLALAHLEDCLGCLRYWQPLHCVDPAFLAQKEQVSNLLLHQLHCRLDANPLAHEEVALLLHEGLLDTLLASELLARCRRLRLACFWQEERLEEIAALADETDWLQPAELEIQAKVACQRLAEATDRPMPPHEVRYFIDCWLTLLFHPTVGPQAGQERQTLLDFGADLLRKQVLRQPQSSGDSLLQHWQNTLSLLSRLADLGAGQSEAVPLLYAPALARRAQVADQLCTLIKNSREAFMQEEEWLAAGAAYTPVAAALVLIQEGQADAALDLLADLEGEHHDPFINWGAAEVRSACGIHLLQQGQAWEAEQILREGLIHNSVELEKQVLATLNQEEDADGRQLTACLGILALLSEEVQERAAFCTALTNQVVRLRSSEEANHRLLAAAMAKAVALHPGDELAQMIHAQMSLNCELLALAEAFNQDCFAEAARIAATSHFPQLKERFFMTAQHHAARIERGDYPDQEAAIFLVESLLVSARSVDPRHATVRQISKALDGLRQGGLHA